jgi:outer membrane protein assembly factor BamB
MGVRDSWRRDHVRPTYPRWQPSFHRRSKRDVYSLDMRTGCYFWDYAASAGVRTAITVARTGGRSIAFFGDRRGRAYAIDAATGETVWKVTADDDSAAQVTGSPVLFEGRLYVPISTGDDSAAVDPTYECCKGRGAVVALDAGNGSVIWKTYTVSETHPQGRNAIGTRLFGPSGASVWAAPTVDGKRRAFVRRNRRQPFRAANSDQRCRPCFIADDSGAVAGRNFRGLNDNAACPHPMSTRRLMSFVPSSSPVSRGGYCYRFINNYNEL